MDFPRPRKKFRVKYFRQGPLTGGGGALARIFLHWEGGLPGTYRDVFLSLQCFGGKLSSPMRLSGKKRWSSSLKSITGVNDIWLLPEVVTYLVLEEPKLFFGEKEVILEYYSPTIYSL